MVIQKIVKARRDGDATWLMALEKRVKVVDSRM